MGSLFRPQKLEELIGCDNIKQAIRIAIDASFIKNDAFPHTLLYGNPGLGKTSLSNIIAKERGGDFKVYLADVFRNRADVQILMGQLNFDNHTDDNTDEFSPKFNVVGPIKPTVIFLDEIHKLKRDTQEAFFQAMEENVFTIEKINRVNGAKEKNLCWVPKFTLIGATTRAGDLDRAFVERFKLTFTLSLYKDEEIFVILKQYSDKTNILVSDDAIVEIAKRSRGVPRKAINYLERSRDMSLFLGAKEITKQITLKTFETLQIDDNGLEPLDSEVLAYLYKVYPSKVGVTRLASILNITENVLKEIVEPYLLRQGLIEATPGGRLITELGMIYCDKHNLSKKTIISERTRKVLENA